MSPNDVFLMELGKFVKSESMNRLVKVRIEHVSLDGKKASVTLLPCEGPRAPLRSETYNSGKVRVVECRHLFRNEKEYRESIEFKNGDLVIFCSPLGNSSEIATVIRTSKSSAFLMGEDNRTFTAKFESIMLIGRTNNQVVTCD